MSTPATPPDALMILEVLLPFQVFVEAPRVSRIVAETDGGAFGLLPRRLDCVAALVPGILTYEIAGEGERYVAVDEGVLVKVGPQVRVSVRRALAGHDLGELREAVEQAFLSVDEQERRVRSVMAKLESGFLKRFVGFEHD